jgi:hypothetical protein
MKVRLANRLWNFAAQRASAIQAHWEQRKLHRPELFDGDILLLYEWSLRDGCFRGQCLQTDFKSFLYWRDHNTADPTVFDFFPAGALHSQEGWLILGRSGPTMSNPCCVYPPCGSLQPSDCRDELIDLDGAILREINEETGLSFSAADLGPALLIGAAPQIVIVRPILIRRSARQIVEEIESFLRINEKPEISETIVVRSRSDIDSQFMPPFTTAYIEHAYPF